MAYRLSGNDNIPLWGLRVRPKNASGKIRGLPFKGAECELYRYLDAEHHRTRFNNFFLVERWAPEAALRQKAEELLRTLRPSKGETLYLIIDDSKKAKRGQAMDAIAKMKESHDRGLHPGASVCVCHPGLP